MSPKSLSSLFLCILMVLGILAFGQVYQFEFVQYDDPAYITENKYVNQGVTIDGLKWAIFQQETGEPLKYDGVNNLFHPLSLISHMIDVQLFGLHSGAHHLINLLFHLLATVFAFLFIKALTRSPWAAFIAAGLFLLHPTHVESVAWASERKDTLSGLFFWASLYVYFGRKDKNLAFILFLLGLLSKPSVVVAPVLIVLLVASHTPEKFSIQNIIKISKQHWHWFLASLVIAAINIYTQGSGSHAFFAAQSSLQDRVLTAGSGYWFYLYRTILPHDLSVAYSVPAFSKYIHYAAVFGVGAVSMTAWRLRNRFPEFFLAVAWFTICWLPTSGITYLAIEFTADRYLYLASAGFFIFFARYLTIPTWGRVVSTIILFACAFLSFQQTMVWKNTKSLFSHSVEARPSNGLGWSNLGAVFQLEKDYDKAIECHNKKLELHSKDHISNHNLGVCYLAKGDLQKAKYHFSRALDLYPAYLASIGQLTKLCQDAQSAEALKELHVRIKAALKIKPKDPRFLLLHQEVSAILEQLR